MKVELTALQCLSVCLCGEFQSKLQSSCNFQPWLQVPALQPAKVKFPSSQGIYLDQKLTTTLDYHRLGSGLTALPDSTSFFIKLTSIHRACPDTSSSSSGGSPRRSQASQET
ncbi:hypothetical protein AMECASPLE_019262 [Ameca splendens]|uniref:Uncharacterized protein n=1 Tax=Ameca splendens TaxID=208324 RepID=A0ABV1A9D7_9TELE